MCLTVIKEYGTPVRLRERAVIFGITSNVVGLKGKANQLIKIIKEHEPKERVKEKNRESSE